MFDSDTKRRTIALIVYAAVLAAVQYFVIEPSLLPSEKSLWFYNGIASLLFGSRLLNPHFTPPADAATNGFLVVVAMLAASILITPGSPDAVVVYTVAILGATVCAVSIVVILNRPDAGPETRPWFVGLDQAVRRLGSPNFIYTVVILAAVWLFHWQKPLEVLAILTTWTVIVALEPVEGVLLLARKLQAVASDKWLSKVVGIIAAHQSPGIVLIRQANAATVERGALLVVSDDRGTKTLAVALNYVGRDEGNLLRALTFPMPAELGQNLESSARLVGPGIAACVQISDDERRSIPESHPASILKRMGEFSGIVDKGTTLDFLVFEVIEDRELAKGSLVEAGIQYPDSDCCSPK